MRTAAALVLGLVIGAAAGAAVAQQVAPGTVLAQRFELVDAQGTTQAAIYLDEYGVPRLDGFGAEPAPANPVGPTAKQFRDWLTRYGKAAGSNEWNDCAKMLGDARDATWELEATVVARPTSGGLLLVDVEGSAVYRIRIPQRDRSTRWSRRQWGIDPSRLTINVDDQPPAVVASLAERTKITLLVSLAPDTNSQPWSDARSLQGRDGAIVWNMRFGRIGSPKVR